MSDSSVRAVRSPLSFESEDLMVESFVRDLKKGKSCYGSVQVIREWDHKAGMVDVLARDCANALVAFEAKLDNWKRAFSQAYRSTAYADRSYVLVPPHVADRAILDRPEFERRGIGLCTYDGKTISVIIEAAPAETILEWIKSRAHEHFNQLPDDRKKRSRSRKGSSRVLCSSAT